MSESATSEGWEAPLTDDADRHAAVDRAFDYRGDVTVTTRDGRTVEGYVFDRQPDRPDPRLRILTSSGERVTLRYDELARLTFTGKDAAHGRSFETWVQAYARKHAAG